MPASPSGTSRSRRRASRRTSSGASSPPTSSTTGCPIHIGAALLGHLNLETTRGYVAVFEEDLVRHYQSFLDRRRSLRPSDGRPYGTPCVHEHACIRCPMLHVSPTMIGRLHELEMDLIAGRSRAHREGWLGETEGLDLTLSHLRGKREQTRRLARATGLVELCRYMRSVTSTQPRPIARRGRNLMPLATSRWYMVPSVSRTPGPPCDVASTPRVAGW